MVENEVKKIERDEIIVCGACNNAIPKDLLERSVGRVKHLYCQYCGVSLNLDYDLKTNNEYSESNNSVTYTLEESNLANIQQNSQESDFTLSYSNIRNTLRSYIFQLIYQLLKSTPLTLKKIQTKKELKSSHINIVLKKIWRGLKELNPNDLANQKLVSSKRRIKNYFEEFQSSLRPYKKFRKTNFTLVAENIEFVFGLILGDYEFSNLTISKKRIVLDLKKCFGFKSDTATTNSFTYNISLILSKKIRSILYQYHITKGNENKLALDEMIGIVYDYIVNNKGRSYDIGEFNSSQKKRFYNTLEALIKKLKTDWIYRKSFEDHIYRLIIIVNSLTNDVDYSTALGGFERLISQGLKQSGLFEKDQDFSPHFKLNFTLILCRVIFLKIKNTPKIIKSSSQSVNLSISDEIKIKNSILDEITAGKKINYQFLKMFYKLLLEKFQSYYEKLQYKLTSDLIYVESFRDYISDLVRLVFNIVHSISKKSHLTKLELAVIKDLANYNFEWFHNKRDRNYLYYPLQNVPDKSALYNTKDLIEDLREDIQHFSEELAQIFPNRLLTKQGNVYSHRRLSQLWVNNLHFIAKLLSSVKKNSDFTVKEEKLFLLQNKLEERLDVKALGCVEIIKRYHCKEINTLQFVNLLEKELGRVTGEIKVTDEELGLILAGTPGFIKFILARINEPNHPYYNPQYKFSKERLSKFRNFLFEIFGNRAKNCFDNLKRFERLNPDLKKYPRQQYTIDNPRFFQNIELNPKASYWFGFLRADGSRSGYSWRIRLLLAKKDVDRLEAFAEAIGLPLTRIKLRTRIKWYKGELKTFKCNAIEFVCRDMAKDIDALGFQSSKAKQKFVPDYVVQALKEAKKMAKQIKIDWWLTLPGKVALAFLLGFYDGDGTYRGGRSAKIFVTDKNFLEHIKELFGIKNKICEDVPPGTEAWIFDQRFISKGMYSLALGPKLFDMMMNSYEHSMVRKRLM